jgi:transcription antitermination protein NusB
MALPHPAHARSRARRFAMQALYQRDLSGTELHEIRDQFLEHEDFSAADREYFVELFNQVTRNTGDIDIHIARFVDLPPGRLDPVERAILRIGTWELMSRPDIPYRVVINEAVQLAKKFGAEQGHTFVNGVLDRLARELRPVEYRQPGTTAGS